MITNSKNIYIHTMNVVRCNITSSIANQSHSTRVKIDAKCDILFITNVHNVSNGSSKIGNSMNHFKVCGAHSF